MAGDPQWVSSVSAVAISAVALIGAYIAWNLWKTNRDLLRERMFDRRFDIFNATQRVIARVETDQGISWHSANELSDIAQQARFMLHDEDARYFDLLRRNALDLAQVTSETDAARLVGYSSQKEERQRLCD